MAQERNILRERVAAPSIPLIPTLRITQRARYHMADLRNLRMDFRPLSLTKPVRIKTSNLIPPGPRPLYEGITYFYFADDAIWQVEYENTTRLPITFKYEQGVDQVKDENRLVLHGKASDKVSSIYRVEKAGVLSAYAKTLILERLIDSVSKNFNIGVLKYTIKPLIEYPEPNLGNEDWTRWGGYEGVKADLWPSYPDPQFPMEYSVKVGGAIPFEGVHYRLPGRTMTFEIMITVTNNYDREQNYWIVYEPAIIVVYEDDAHVSWLGGGMSTFKIGPKLTRTHTYTLAMPSSIYGKVLLFARVVGWTPVVGVLSLWNEYKVGDMIPP